MTSGIRVGTPAITRRGFKEAEAKELAGWMCDVLDSINDEAVIERIKGKVLDICARYPGLRISETVICCQCARCSCRMRRERLIRPTKLCKFNILQSPCRA
ncbi:serine hydroxymethyltransferase [Escherichia coli]|nr:serine hydroxymethyltransferase [Escherichia coli]